MNQLSDLLLKLPKDCIITGLFIVSLLATSGWSLYSDTNAKIESGNKLLEDRQDESKERLEKQIDNQREKIAALEKIAVNLSVSLEAIQQDTAFIKGHYLRRGMEGS